MGCVSLCVWLSLLLLHVRGGGGAKDIRSDRRSSTVAPPSWWWYPPVCDDGGRHPRFTLVPCSRCNVPPCWWRATGEYVCMLHIFRKRRLSSSPGGYHSEHKVHSAAVESPRMLLLTHHPLHSL